MTSLLRFYFLCFLLTIPALTTTAASITQGDKTFLPLSHAAKKLGLQFKAVTPEKSATLSNQKLTLSFEVHKNYTFINNQKVFLGTPVIFKNKQLCIAQDDFEYTLCPLLKPQTFKHPPQLKHIVIDPGHGGTDKGTQNKSLGLREKDLTLDISLRLERILKRAGYQVSLTRRSDKFVGLHERSKKANHAKADLFVSIHLNAVSTNASTVMGAETFILPLINQPSTGRSDIQEQDKQSYPGNKQAPWSMILGYCVQTSLINEVNATDRGLKRARFAVLKELHCPGILIESGFLTNPQEGKKLATAAYREKLANAIANGIIRYGSALEKVRAKNSS